MGWLTCPGFNPRTVFFSSGSTCGGLRPDSGTNPRSPPVAAEFTYGWLCFETTGEKRRLAPVPEGWDRADDETIEQWCCVAKPAARRKTAEVKGKGVERPR